jgi:hypothetical protein
MWLDLNFTFTGIPSSIRRKHMHTSFRGDSPLMSLQQLSAFRDRGSLGRRVNYRRMPQTRWVGARRSAKGGGSRREEVEISRPSCLSHAQVGCACSRGLQASTREGSERPHASACPVLFPARPTLSKRALVLPFIGARRGSRCTMGGVAEC